jgi:hypothetical protein
MHDHAYFFFPGPGRLGGRFFGPQAKKRDDCLRCNGASTAVVSLAISVYWLHSAKSTIPTRWRGSREEFSFCFFFKPPRRARIMLVCA